MMDHTAPLITDATLGDACAALRSCADCVSLRRQCGFCMLGNGSATCWPRAADPGDALSGFCMDPLPDQAEWAVGYCPSSYSWMAVIGLVVYLFCFAPGMGPVPWLLNSEIHAMWARDVSLSVSTSSNWLFNLIMSLSFLSLMEVMGTSGAFFLYATVTFTGVIALWLMLPETKGVSLEEIEYLFGKQRDGEDTHGNNDRKVRNVTTIAVRP